METRLAERRSLVQCQKRLLTSSEVELMETQVPAEDSGCYPKLLTSSEVELMETVILPESPLARDQPLLTSSEVELMETNVAVLEKQQPGAFF